MNDKFMQIAAGVEFHIHLFFKKNKFNLKNRNQFSWKPFFFLNPLYYPQLTAQVYSILEIYILLYPLLRD